MQLFFCKVPTASGEKEDKKQLKWKLHKKVLPVSQSQWVSSSKSCIDTESAKLPQLLNKLYLMQGLIREKCFNYNDFVVVTCFAMKRLFACTIKKLQTVPAETKETSCCRKTQLSPKWWKNSSWRTDFVHSSNIALGKHGKCLVNAMIVSHLTTWAF